MIYNQTSLFPSNIDDLIFFQDAKIKNIDQINIFQNLIQQQKYSDANEYISQQSDIHGQFASLLNMIENRIHEFQIYLQTYQKINIFHSGDESDISEGEFWYGED